MRETASDRPPCEAERGLVIAAFLGTQAIGNFIMYHLVAASIARAVPGGRLVVIYRDDRPYKGFINMLNPYVTTTLKANADSNFVIPLDWFDGETDVSGRPFGEEWYEQGFHKPDILLTPSMLDIEKCLWPAPQFRVPSDIAPILTEALIRRGVDKDRWFASVHMREAGYKWRPGSDPPRNVDPKTYIPMITNIIHRQGGQVVRLGHPAMTPLPEMDGLIDLSRQENNFPEQAFAASRARYFIGTDTGATQIAAAFKTPAAATNALGIGVWNDGDVVLLQKFIRSDGGMVDMDDLVEIASQLGNHRLSGVELAHNSPGELIAVADHMHEITSDCQRWREEVIERPSAAMDSITLPFGWKSIADVVNLTFW